MNWVVVQAVAFAVGLAGVALALAGLVGTRTGTGRHCRRCGYDVGGIIEEQDVCPECGRSIAGKKATASGTRVRRPALIVAGILLLLPASGTGWYISTMVQPVRARPTWLLAAVLRVGPTSDNNDLARELLTRWGSGDVGGFGRDALIDWGLSAWVGGHESRSWQHAEIVRYAIAADAIEQQDADRFMEQVLADIGDSSDTARQRLALAVAASLGTAVRPRLERALDEPRFRDAAVMLLLDELGNAPSGALIAAAADALAHRPAGREAGPALDRLPLSIEARRAARYLTHHARACAPRLRGLLASGDAQVRLLAALALTEAGIEDDAEPIGRAVAAALAPNDTPGDAGLATRALLRAGPAALAAAERETSDPTARLRLREIRAAFDDRRPVPPHLERLAGPLPWQRPSPARPRSVPPFGSP